MRDTRLSQADPFVKVSITAVLSGMASKASGGDFVQGAMSAMVVWLYNEAGGLFKSANEAAIDAIKNCMAESLKEGYEHGGIIYKKGKLYGYTKAHDSKNPIGVMIRKGNWLSGKRRIVGFYHTHLVRYVNKLEYDTEHFSDGDKNMLQLAGRNWTDAYVGTRGGMILHYSPVFVDGSYDGHEHVEYLGETGQ